MKDAVEIFALRERGLAARADAIERATVTLPKAHDSDLDYWDVDTSMMDASHPAKASHIDYEFEMLLDAPEVLLTRSHAATAALGASTPLIREAGWPTEWEYPDLAALASPGTTHPHRYEDRSDDDYGFDHDYNLRFAMEEPAVGTHAVLFFDDEATRLREVVTFVSDGVRAGETVFLALTSSIAESLRAALPADVLALAERAGGLIIVEARATLKLLVRDGILDPMAFENHVASDVRRFREERGPVRVYGEMVTLLWSDDNVVAALHLEQLWNQLQKEFAVTVLCAYPLALVAEGSEEFASVSECHSHAHVV